MKMWQGRFKSDTSKLMEAFNGSINFDKRLFEVDVKGSKAHIQMLEKIGVLSEDEKEQLMTGLNQLLLIHEAGEFNFAIEDEDIHMAIEKALTELIGDVAKKMHTGRSRNDQVATDLRLYTFAEIQEIQLLLKDVMNTLVQLSEKHFDYVVPGYTHLQKAQPILLSYLIHAYIHMFQRDYERLEDMKKRVMVLPLGCGALAGTNYKSDRAFVKESLGFNSISLNGLDAVSDRDFVIEMLSNLSIVMMHLSRFAEEMIIWSMNELEYMVISDGFSTGSSLMPQKKNPDACELIRGKTGRVYGSLMSILTVMKALPLAYNKDMQEDKEGLFDSIDTVKMVLMVFESMISEVTFNKEKLRKSVEQSFLNATDLADYLVMKGIPFRTAHHLTGAIVKHAIDHDCYLLDLPLDAFKGFHEAIDKDIYDYLDFDFVIMQKQSQGSTSLISVEEDLLQIKEWLKNS